jgi:erythromycin esterase
MDSLSRKGGFAAIAIESSFPRGRLVDQYIAGLGPDSFDDILELGFSQRPPQCS